MKMRDRFCFRNLLKLFIMMMVLLLAGCYTDEDTDGGSGGGGGDTPSGSSKLSSIQITNPANKIIYNMGDTYDPSGIEVTATYHSGKTKLVTGWVATGFDSSQNVATQTITITYSEDGHSRFTQYEIRYANLSGLQITNPATKLIYRLGDPFDYSGIEVAVNYKDGSTKILDGSKLTYSGFDSSQNVATQTITVKYTEKGLSYYAQYEIRYSNYSGLQITNPANKLIYSMGDTFDYTGLRVIANYKDGRSKPVDNTKLQFIGFDSSQNVTTQTITIKYTENNASYYTQFEIRYSNLSGIQIVRPAKKLVYNMGDVFDYEELEVVANYKDGSTKTIANSDLDFSGFDSSKNVSNQTIVITYNENGIYYYTQYEIRYATINGIQVTQPPSKTKYRVGAYADYKNRDVMSVGGIELTITRADGSSETLKMNDLVTPDASGFHLVEFFNADDLTKTCTKYYDVPRTKEIDIDGDGKRTLQFTGFAFAREDQNPQITITYTEDYNGTKVTRTGSFSVSYDYTPTYKFTDYHILKGDKYYYGDYPQSNKADDVIVCSKSIEKGMFKYYIGSDGCYYVNGNHVNAGNKERYFKVEPIEWVRYTSPIPITGYADYLWVSAKILDGGVQYYPAINDFDRVETDALSYRIEQDKNWYRAATYNYHYSVTSYQKSLLADFLNGTNESGLGLYNGKGFYQTAFTDTKINGYVYPIEIKEIVACDGFWYDTHVDGSTSNLVTPDDIKDGGKIRKPYYQNVVPYYYDGATEHQSATKVATDYASYASSGILQPRYPYPYYSLPVLDGNSIDFKKVYYCIDESGKAIAKYTYETNKVNIGIAPVIRPFY